MGWLMIFFDLPVKEKIQRHYAAKFRKDLIKNGYFMVQYSVYTRPCPSMDRIKTHTRRLKRFIPPSGEIRCIYLTDAQWGKMIIFQQQKAKEPEELPEQILLF